MEDEIKRPPRKEIRNLLTVIAGGVLGAALLSGLMLYYYSPVGSYSSQNVILSPTIISELNFQDLNPQTGVMTTYVYAGTELSYYNAEKKEWRHHPVTKEAYKKFYDLVSGERSLPSITPAIEVLFNQTNPAILTLKVRTQNKDERKDTSKVFLEIAFAVDSDYYRVQLRESGPTGSWAYYYHPHIYRDAIRILSP